MQDYTADVHHPWRNLQPQYYAIVRLLLSDEQYHWSSKFWSDKIQIDYQVPVLTLSKKCSHHVEYFVSSFVTGALIALTLDKMWIIHVNCIDKYKYFVDFISPILVKLLWPPVLATKMNHSIDNLGKYQTLFVV